MSDGNKCKVAKDFYDIANFLEVEVSNSSSNTAFVELVAKELAKAHNDGYDAGVADENEFWHSNKR